MSYKALLIPEGHNREPGLTLVYTLVHIYIHFVYFVIKGVSSAVASLSSLRKNLIHGDRSIFTSTTHISDPALAEGKENHIQPKFPGDLVNIPEQRSRKEKLGTNKSKYEIFCTGDKFIRILAHLEMHTPIDRVEYKYKCDNCASCTICSSGDDASKKSDFSATIPSYSQIRATCYSSSETPG